MINKKIARALMIKKIKKYPHINSNLYQKLYQTRAWYDSHVIAVTMSTHLEINTKPIIHKAWQQEKTVAVPKIFQNKKMHFFQIKPNTKMIYDKYNIKEPLDSKLISSGRINLMIVPGLAFSLNNHNRLGYGGGYYDRYLKYYHGATIALARPCQCFSKVFWYIDKHDKSIDDILY